MKVFAIEKTLKITICLLLFFLLGTEIQVKSQSYYYCFNDSVLIQRTNKYVLLKQDGALSDSSLLDKMDTIFSQSFHYLVFGTVDSLDSIDLSNYTTLFPVYKVNGDDAELGLTNEIVFQLKDTLILNSFLNEFNLTLVKQNEVYASAKVSSGTDPLLIANNLYQTGLVTFAHPDFLIKAIPAGYPPPIDEYEPYDPYYSHQFYLHNTGQTINEGHACTAGADINMLKAWQLTLGNENIVIAVIDIGVTSDHPDLPDSRQIRLPGSNITASGDQTDPNDPSPFGIWDNGNYNHGNACAGIIAAEHNDEGISGIAPYCKILPVRVNMGGNMNPSTVYAEALLFAANSGAHIISSSWSIAVFNELIIRTIYDVVSVEGKRCNVLFAAGNTADRPHHTGKITFPACYSDNAFIVVGASNRFDSVAAYSPRGNISVVAPSSTWYLEDIYNTNNYIKEYPDMWTIDAPDYGGMNSYPPLMHDLPGAGTNYLSYTGHFGGTSAACAQVTGVVALMLSVNPDLSPVQVKDILESTARKIGPTDNNENKTNGIWNSDVGYGVVDAHRAVLKANYRFFHVHDIILPCNDYNFSMQKRVDFTDVTYTWNTSNNIELVEGDQEIHAIIRTKEPGPAWIEFTVTHMGESATLHHDMLIVLPDDKTRYTNFSTTGSFTISSDVYIDGVFYINSGDTVTINSPATVYGTPSAEIIVKCGGKLFVNGAKLTSICEDGLWQGIKVQGNTHLPQNINNTNQGIVIMENEAVIENAICGISAKQSRKIHHIIPGKEIIINTGGGIIVANNTHFINNLQAIGMYSYVYSEDPMNYGNISYFSNCEFKITKSDLYSGYQVYLEDVQSVTFYGCRFIDNTLQNNSIAIYVNNAGALINPCIPGTSSTPPFYSKRCIFEGYHTAIHIQNTGSKTIKIMNAEFTNNCIAIKAVGSNALGIKSCIFNVHSNNCSSYYGVVLDNCNQYVVQNNRFYGNYDGIGLLISGNVENNNSIKYNDFTNFCIACNINGRHGNGYENENITGLQFLCNRYENNSKDIRVDGNGSIRYYQGDHTNASGNEFYIQSMPPHMTTNIENLSEMFFYFYNQQDGFQMPLNYNNVRVIGTNADRCMGYGYLGLYYYIVNPEYHLIELENNYLMYETEYNRALIEYINNYEGVSIEWQDYHGEDFFDQPQVIDFMNLSYLKENMDETSKQAVSLLLSMEEIDKNQYHMWLSRSHTLFNSYVLAESYLSNRNIPEMEMLLNTIPIDFPAYDRDEYRDYLVCSRYLSSWRSMDPEAIILSKEAIDSLENIAASAPNLAAVYAKSILESLGKEVTYTEMPNICDCTPGFVTEQNENSIQKQNHLMTQPDIIIHPNPANDRVEIKVINSSFGIRKIMIYDVYGKTAWRKNIEAKDLLLLDINELSKGLYFIYCELENKQTIIKKLVKN